MRWTLKPKPDPEKVANLAQSLGVTSSISSLLIQREIDTYEKAKNFFRPSLDNLHNPFLMKDMDKAVNRIEKAIAQGENILVYGDYDVDGTTSVALVSSFLETIHSQVDCGVKAIEKVAYAKQKGIDFIICDHHRPGDTLPDAVAILDPKRSDCTYPYDELCGCGVGFKLISGISLSRKRDPNELLPYLDLVATAIGADIVPITGENRILAYHGLRVINTAPRAGFEAIIKQIKKDVLTITDVVFIIAPRINAAGRMKHGNHAVTLLRETDYDTACNFAVEIEEYNADRREADKSITEQALEQIISNKEENNKTTVVFQEDWHKGVIGIVASRLTETYYRPTLVFTRSGDKYAASARSVKGFDVYNALQACEEYIEQFGGHKYAAGLTLLPEQYENFKAKFEEVVAATCDERLLVPEINIDANIDLVDITPKFYRILKQFAPFGPLNMSPTFMTKNLTDTGYGKKVGGDQTHLKITVAQNNRGQRIGGIGFNLGGKLDVISDKKSFMAAYAIDENVWNGEASLQLRLI